MKKIERYILLYIISVFIFSVLVLVLFGKRYNLDGALVPVDIFYAVFWTINAFLGNEPYQHVFQTIPIIQFVSLLNSLTSVIAVSYLIAKITETLLRIDVVERDTLGKTQRMSNHIIVCGAGRVGMEVINTLRAAKRHRYIIIEMDSKKVETLREQNELVIRGDATSHETLLKAGIVRAAAIICCAGRDAVNLFTILSAREMNPKIFIASRASSEEMESKLRGAGADLIVLPEVVGGREIGELCLRIVPKTSTQFLQKKDQKPAPLCPPPSPQGPT